MGIFNKLKKAANFLTGGGAEVTLEINGENLNESLTVDIKVKVDENDLNAEGVYLNVKCVELITEVIETEDGEDTEENTNILYEENINIVEATVLEAGKEYSFSKELALPEDSIGSIIEDNREVAWEFQAGVDVKGNDPDSGWIKVNLIK